MSKSESKLALFENTPGIITIKVNNYVQSVDIRKLAPEEKFETVRAEILSMGLVFSRKTERLVRKMI